MGDEGGFGDLGGLGPAADGDREHGAGRGMGGRHEAEGDGAAEGRGEAARGDLADHGAGGIEDFGAFAGRLSQAAQRRAP